SIGEFGRHRIAFLPRHGYEHEFLPHKINYRANIYGLYKLGVQRIFATNAVGAINPKFQVGDIVVPHDLIDFTKQRPLTFFDESPDAHIDFTEPYCNELRKTLIQAAKRIGEPIHECAVYACMEGPRYETAAEIRMLGRLGCDIVGMTGIPEAVLARELGICYASLCYVSNMAAGMRGRISHQKVTEVASLIRSKLSNLLMQAILYLPKSGCCHRVLSDKHKEKRK
ncbi:TPA: S-methyl-5'-thioinosine phosphorylase, partial [Candidatus Bathyarchaeota archaeon]|nr:S-methyl-5'-thioinosine phosphorylase [Candidatus Bathyarchaeota archaeon]